MAFVGIFYPFVFLKDLKSRRNIILTSKWEKLRNFIDSKTREINNIMKKSKKRNVDLASKLLSEISEELGIFEEESRILEVEKHVTRSIFSSFVTIFLYVFTIFFLPSFYLIEGVSIVQFIFIFLLASIYYAIRLVIAWHKIHE